MIRTAVAALAAALAFAAAIEPAGCASWKPAADIAEEAARSTCIAAHAELPDSEILKQCGLAFAFIDLVRKLAGETRQRETVAAARAVKDAERAGVCRPVAAP